MDRAQWLRDKRAIRLETARIGYQIAVSLWSYQGTEVWNRFNVLVLSNSLLVTAIFLAPSQETSLRRLMAFIGVILCIVWFSLVKRGFAYMDYYIDSARELEERHLSKHVKTVSRGSTFGQGKIVPIKLNGSQRQHRILPFARLRTRNACHFIIDLFAVLYLSILVVA